MPKDGGSISGDRLAQLDALAHRLGLEDGYRAKGRRALFLGQQFYNDHPGHACGRILR